MINAAMFDMLPAEAAERFRSSAEHAMRRAGVDVDTAKVTDVSVRNDLTGQPVQFVTVGIDAAGDTHEWAELYYG